MQRARIMIQKRRFHKIFFAEVQNKFLFAVSEKTAPELIFSRANADEKNMGLQTWKWQKTGQKIVETDIVVGKNYLNEKEISELNLLVSGYLDYAELQAKKWNIMYMKDEDKRRKVVEFETFVNILGNAYKYYTKASYVQKRKIIKILFLNIKIDHKKRLQIAVKPELETLFMSDWSR